MTNETIAIRLSGTPQSDARILLLALKHKEEKPSLSIYQEAAGGYPVFTYDGSPNSVLQVKVLAAVIKHDLARALRAAPVMQEIRDKGKPGVYQPKAETCLPTT